ncbi:cation diffusion facilitator family transporter [Siphonobacter aquaeclarae]|jgi:cation diffusion facilitator family transporter|uniref:Cation diffusion facilitator family transporter n=1 Tax=Siphonobacter aquaeclarae TaxID=563176 RepID=A0A1G9RX05_9BACT|nr:cation diffusion facilitator family transporter [Siphonobacter aquaeclarae]SDM27015.1 cation diffusion facilitator family transporter [Siphonobacter aquaeclarae]
MSSNRKLQLIWLSFGVSVFLMLLKFAAWWLTGSSAILSDALESIVNVLATGFATYSVYLSAQPRDLNHPYGHGKIEFFSAGLEGVLILLAGIFIIVQAVRQWIYPEPLEELGTGMLLVGSTMVINYVVGYYVQKEGEKQGSPSLIADGKHLQLDAFSTLILLVGVGLVLFSGYVWLDRLISIVFGIILILNGFRIARKSAGGLMDEVDDTTLLRVVDILKTRQKEYWIDVHNLRIQQYGADLHVDCHLTLPYYWDLEKVHSVVHEFEAILEEEFASKVEIFVHVDPCLPACCHHCRLADCPVRQFPRTTSIDWTRENLVLNQKHFLETLKSE